jgi:hypothetical protein
LKGEEDHDLEIDDNNDDFSVDDDILDGEEDKGEEKKRYDLMHRGHTIYGSVDVVKN